MVVLRILEVIKRFLEGFWNVFKNVLQKRSEILFGNSKKSLKKKKKKIRFQNQNKTFSKRFRNVFC